MTATFVPALPLQRNKPSEPRKEVFRDLLFLLMKRFLPILLLALAVSCQKPATYEDYISSVTVEPTENALRFKVEIGQKRECTPVVEVRAEGSETWTAMPGRTAMFLYSETNYEARVRVGELTGDPILFTSGSLPAETPAYTVEIDNGGPKEGYMLYAKENAPGFLCFTDMQGKVIWYERFEGEGVRCMHYDPSQGKIAVLAGHKDEEASTSMHRPRYGQHLYVIDLEGNRLSSLPTTAEFSEFPHHEAKLMPDGNILTVEATIGYYDLSSEGGSSNADVWGDGYVILSPEGRRLASFDCLPALDLPNNMDWLNPVLYQYDLIHANSVSWDENGDFYMTFHYIGEIWKINGKTGKVAYRLGRHGNLNLDGEYATGGFHAVVPLAPDKFLVNNNGPKMGDPTNAQIYEVDPVAMTARRTMSIPSPKGYSSTNGGNVEILPDGKTILFNITQSRACVFTDMEGNLLKVITRAGTSYRAFYFERLY